MLSCTVYYDSLSLPQGIEHLKPHIVHSLANAELYCLALSHLYADPNYHNLNHWGVIQVLARKGIFVAEPADCSLTETVLIQTTPLKMVRRTLFMFSFSMTHVGQILGSDVQILGYSVGPFVCMPVAI